MTTAGRRPNILWISTHDINPDLGCYRGLWPGAEAASTPHLDAFAAEGVRFDRAFATTPVCGPSRSAVMTGCFPTAIGTHHMRSKAVPPPEVRLLPEYLRGSGYYVTNNVFTDFQVPVPGTAFDDCSPTAHWRNRPDPEQPFFAMFHGMATHESQIYLEEDEFAARTASLREAARHRPEDVPLPPYHPDDAVFRTSWARYHNLISVMDLQVGNLLAQLEEDGLAEDTVVMFWSDHGAGFPRAKRWATEAGLRVPLLMRWPGRIPAGHSRPDVVHLADIAPTVLELAGVPVPEHMQMRPLLTADGADVVHHGLAFGGRDRMDEQRDSSRTVRDARYRYIRHRHPDRSPFQWQHFAEKFSTWQDLRVRVNAEARQRAAGHPQDQLTALQRAVTGPYKPSEELYDLETDPHETTNLAADPHHATVLEHLSGALDSWLAEVGDLGEVPEEELIARWRPEGAIPRSAPPQVTETGDGFSVAGAEPGTLVAWTADPPPAHPPQLTLQEEINGDPEPDGRTWNIHDGPLPHAPHPRWVRAWRLGHRGSDEILLPAA